MQHKFLFAALLCGAMCLTGCLKNEESDSVENVRNAKANELNASADLLKAQATAETVRANADAALAAAQAKVAEANAAKIAAETEYQKVQNQIAALEVQLKQITYDTKKAELEVKKKEYELQLKELEAQILWANEALAEAQAEIELALAQLDYEMQKAQIELAAQQAALDLLIQQKAAEQAAADYAYIQEISDVYFGLESQILAWEQEIAQKEFEIELLSFEMEEDFDQVLEDYLELWEEYDEIEIEYERLAALYEWIEEEYLTMTEDELEDAKLEAKALLIEFRNYLADAQEAYVEAGEAVAAADDAIENTKYYEYTWYNDDYHILGNLESRIGASWYYNYDEDGNYLEELAYYNAEGEYTPLFQDSYWAFKDVISYDDANEIYDLAEMSEKGINLPASAHYYEYYDLVPAKTHVDAVEAAIDEQIDLVKENAEAQKVWAADQKEAMIEIFQNQLDVYNAEFAKYQEYLAEAEPIVTAQEEKVSDLLEAYNAAYEAFQAKSAEQSYAWINNVEVKEALEAWDRAMDTVEIKINYLNNVAVPAANEAYDALIQAEADSIDLDNMIISSFPVPYPVTNGVEALKNRDYRRAELQGAIKVAEKNLADGAAKKTAYENAVKAEADAKKAFEDAQKDEATKYAAYQAAREASTADPYNTDKATATTNAETAWTNAKTVTGEKETAWNTAKGTLTTAAGEYLPLVEAVENAQLALAAFDEEMKEADLETALQLAAEHCAMMRANDEVAYQNYLDAIDAYNEATDKAAEAQDNYLKVAQDYDDYVNAIDDEAYEAWIAAWEVYNTESLILNRMINNEYTDYTAYAWLVNEEENEDCIQNKIAELEEKIETVPYDYNGDGEDETFEEYIAQVEGWITDAEDEKEFWMELINLYEEQYKPAYDEAIEAYNEANYEAYVCKVTVDMLQNIVNALVDEYNALTGVTFIDENGNEVEVEAYLANLEAQMEAKIAQLENKVDQINALIDNYNQDAIDDEADLETLEAEIVELQNKIALYSIIADKYFALINEWLALQ